MAVTQEAIDGSLYRLKALGHDIAVLSRSGGGVLVANETSGLAAYTGRIQRVSAYYFLRGMEAGLALRGGEPIPKATDRGSENTPEIVTTETVATTDTAESAAAPE